MGGGQRNFSIAARKSSTADYERITAWCQDGTVTLVIEHVYAIDDVAESLERFRSGKTKGKLVVKISEGER
jgi:NADPH:quinone reductase-like Zn-dependent oxidoreductase